MQRDSLLAKFVNKSHLMPHRKSRRMSASSAYIGAGNNTSDFNKKARKPWDKLPERFLDKSKSKQQLKQKEFSEADPKALKERLVQEQKEARKKVVIRLGIAFIIGLILIPLLIWLISLLFN